MMKSLLSAILDSLFYSRKIKKLLLKTNFVDSRDESKALKFSVKRDYVEFQNFNPNYSTEDFKSKTSLLNEIFDREFTVFERINLTTIRAYSIDYKKPYQVKRYELCVGWNGREKININEQLNSYYVFGKMRRGKSTLIKALINMYKKINSEQELYIVSAKKSDFLDYADAVQLSYQPEDLEKLNQILDEIEERRQRAENTLTQMRSRILFVFDEFQYLAESKEILKKIYNLIRIGASQKIRIILASQSALSTQYKEININMVSVKISVGRPESKALAETLFNKDFAEQVFKERIEKGYGYVITDEHEPAKIKFYYEPKI